MKKQTKSNWAQVSLNLQTMASKFVVLTTTPAPPGTSLSHKDKTKLNLIYTWADSAHGWSLIRDLRETIEYGPLCITDLFQNKSVAYF